MIEPEKYNALPLEEKLELLWYYGEFIESITEDRFDVSLYELEGIYVEVFYCLNSNSLTDIRVIEDHCQLERYTSTMQQEEASAQG